MGKGGTQKGGTTMTCPPTYHPPRRLSSIKIKNRGVQYAAFFLSRFVAYRRGNVIADGVQAVEKQLD